MRNKNWKRPNAYKHGAFTLIAILPGEDLREFEELHSALVEEWKPQGETEEEAVLSIAKGQWRKRRVQKYVEIRVAKNTLDPSLPSFDERMGLTAFASLMRDEPETAFKKASRCLLPDKINYLMRKFPRSNFESTSEWAEAIINEINSVPLAEFMIAAPFTSAAAFTEEIFKQELALDERIDAMIDRAVKRLIQTKAIKQMLDQARV